MRGCGRRAAARSSHGAGNAAENVCSQKASRNITFVILRLDFFEIRDSKLYLAPLAQLTVNRGMRWPLRISYGFRNPPAIWEDASTRWFALIEGCASTQSRRVQTFARMIESLLPVLRELGLVTIFWDVYFGTAGKLFDSATGKITDPAYSRRVEKFLNELVWMARALRHARESLPAA